MKTRSILAFAAALTLSFAAHAHDCSGGTGGGMDATGNQCNDALAYAPAAAPVSNSATTPAIGAGMATSALQPTSSKATTPTHRRGPHAANKRHTTPS